MNYLSKPYLLIFMVLPVWAMAQIVDDVVKVSYNMPREDASLALMEHQFTVKGSPYIEKAFKMGSVVRNKNRKDSVFMRFNAYRDYIEFLDDHQKNLVLLQDEEIEATLAGTTYRYIPYISGNETRSGYFNPLSEGETALYRKTTKTIPKFEFPAHGYESFKPPQFMTRTHYYIKKKLGPAKKLAHLSRKEVFAILWDKYSELRSYSKKHRLKLRTEAEVIQILEYYDALVSGAQEKEEGSSN